MPPPTEVLRNQSTPWSLLWSSSFSSQSHLQFAMPPPNVTRSQSPSNLPYPPPSFLGISKTGTISMCSSNEVREIPSFLLIPSFWWQTTERGEFLFFIRIVPPVSNSPSQLLVGKSLPLIRLDIQISSSLSPNHFYILIQNQNWSVLRHGTNHVIGDCDGFAIGTAQKMRAMSVFCCLPWTFHI